MCYIIEYGSNKNKGVKTMHHYEKEVFIKELIENVEKEILSKSFNTPENWDGIELRWLISESFNSIILPIYTDKRSNRYKNYKRIIK